MTIRIEWDKDKLRYAITEPGFDSKNRLNYAFVYPFEVYDAKKIQKVYLLVVEEMDKDYVKTGSLRDYLPKNIFDFVYDKEFAKAFCHKKAVEIARSLAIRRNCKTLEDVTEKETRMITLK